MLDDPAYAATNGQFGVFTNWIETEFTNTIEPYTGTLGNAEAEEKATYVVEVNGKRIEVKVPATLGAPAAGKSSGTAPKPTKRSRSGATAKAPSTNSLQSPMQGTIVKVAVAEGDTVAEGCLLYTSRCV